MKKSFRTIERVVRNALRLIPMADPMEGAASGMVLDRRRARRRATASVELLESRLLLSAASPTNAEQYMLELINSARANPAAYAKSLAIDLNEGLPAGTISTDAKQPLAFNPSLISATTNHSQWMFNTGIFAHYETLNGAADGTPATATPGYTGVSPFSRDENAGYTFGTSDWFSGENIAYDSGASSNEGTIQSIQQLLFVDAGITGRGHRVNLMLPDYSEIGLGVLDGNFQGFSVTMTTQDFAHIPGNPFLTGVAYTDTNSNQFYDPGEGLGAIKITATSNSSATFTTTTWDSGGYSLALPAGTYTVTASGAGMTTIVRNDVVVGAQNVEEDFVSGQSAPVTPTPTPTAPTTPTPPAAPSTPTTPTSNGTPILTGPTPTPPVVQSSGIPVFTAQPTSVPTGTVLAPVQVSIEDTNGHIVTSDFSQVVLSIGSGPAGGAILGSTAEQVVNGVATFSNLSFSVPGTYVLQAKDNRLPVASSAAFNIGDIADHAAHQQYVTQLYHDILNRAPDSTGLDQWTALLDSGNANYASVAAQFTSSQEYDTLFVTGLYQTYLSRQPDAAGLSHWTTLMQSGVSNDQIRAGILDSTEYFHDVGGTNQLFVTALYTTLLGRSPDATGLAAWTHVLAQNSDLRMNVISGILNSTESHSDMVMGFYHTYLDRTADDTGLASWDQQIGDGISQQQVIDAFVSSAEYLDLHAVAT